MSVFELAIFMRVFRDEHPVDPGDVAATVGHWFNCDVTAPQVGASADRMIRKGWLTHREGGLRAAPDGRDQARVSLHGITTFMNMGTKLLDVAMMMKVLNIAKLEVDPPYEEDLDPIDEDLDHPDAPDRWLTRDGWSDINPATGRPDPWGDSAGGNPGAGTGEDADTARGDREDGNANDAAPQRRPGENDDDKQ